MFYFISVFVIFQPCPTILRAGYSWLYQKLLLLCSGESYGIIELFQLHSRQMQYLWYYHSGPMRFYFNVNNIQKRIVSHQLICLLNTLVFQEEWNFLLRYFSWHRDRVLLHSYINPPNHVYHCVQIIVERNYIFWV